MTDPVSTARGAREALSRGLNALQADPTTPPFAQTVMTYVAHAMAALHSIERSEGRELTPHADVALQNVRAALNQLQSHPTPHPAVSKAVEAVASSLAAVHGLSRQAGGGAVAPAAAAPPAAPGFPAAGPGFPPAAPGGFAPPTGPAAPFAATAMAPAPVAPAPVAPAPVAHAPAAPAAVAPAAVAPAAVAPQAHAPAAPAVPSGSGASYSAAAFAATAAVSPEIVAQLNVPMGAPPAAPAAPAAAPSADASGLNAPPSDHALVEAALGTHSPTNFYKGLSGNDIIEHGGLFIATYNRMPKLGAPLRVRVSLPGGYEFEADAVVRWRREHSEGSDAPPGFGAQFTRITPDAKQLVYRYVRNREPLFHDDF